MKYIAFIIVLILLISCDTSKEKEIFNIIEQKAEINSLLDSWHKNAAEANFDAYFNAMSNTSIFIGTDASENWNLEAFKNYSKPYFDKGKAWSFTSIERNIFVDTGGEIAWFDELLDTWSGVCRGSGVLKKTNNSWKIEHYVLSIAIPNDNVGTVKELNSKHDSIFIKKFKK